MVAVALCIIPTAPLFVVLQYLYQGILAGELYCIAAVLKNT